MTADLVWEDPEPKEEFPEWVARITAALEERPDQWAIISEAPHGGSSDFLMRNMPGVEIKERLIRDEDGSATGRWNYYGRWIGTDKPQPITGRDEMRRTIETESYGRPLTDPGQWWRRGRRDKP